MNRCDAKYHSLVRDLNRAFRRAGPLLGRTVFDGVWLLADEVLAEGTTFQWQALTRVQGVYAQAGDAVGTLEDEGYTAVAGRKIKWWVDYVERGTPMTARDPSNNATTCRMIMVALADEV